MTDTFTNTVQTLYPRACGNIDYVIRDKVLGTIPTWASVADSTDVNFKTIDVQTNSTDIIGNYTMTLTGTMRSYPLQTITLEFKLNVTEFKNDQLQNVAVRRGTAPVIEPPIPIGTIAKSYGTAWNYKFKPTDPDNDLSSVNIRMGTASVFINYSRANFEFSIAANNTAELTGSWPVTIELIDDFRNSNTYSFTLVIECAAGKVKTAGS